MDWYDLGSKYHTLTFGNECRLTSLQQDWQRELAALWRLEADVNNGGYLQFVSNWGRESYVYAHQGLVVMGASRMVQIIETCQGLVDEHSDTGPGWQRRLWRMLPNPIIGPEGILIKGKGSSLPRNVLGRIYDLSYEFMDYPDDIATLGLKHYAQWIEATDDPET